LPPNAQPVLILSNTLDFAIDYIVAELRRRQAPYVRLNLDALAEDEVSLDPLTPRLEVRQSDGTAHNITSPRAILYRAPTHLRESSGHRYSPEELLTRHQWTAFARSLMVFRHTRWMNDPGNTFRAENKPFQLAIAKQLGLEVPDTRVTNTLPEFATNSPPCERWAIKSLDSFLLRINEKDAFLYTQCVTTEELSRESLKALPFMMQYWLEPKTDIRATVIGERCLSASVDSSKGRINGDWRLEKDHACFSAISLPSEVESKCVSLTKELGLVFAAIDLAVVGNQWYFLEANPTGEWSWLIDSAGLRIDRAIVDELLTS